MFRLIRGVSIRAVARPLQISSFPRSASSFNRVSGPFINTITANGITGNRRYSVKTTDGKETADEIDDLDVNQYHRVTEDYLELLTDHLVDLGQEFPGIDAEYSHGVLTLDLPPNGTYVINKQPPNKQIWLSSPVSGPDRFDPINGNWVSLRTKEKLGDILRREVAAAIEQEVELDGIDDQ